MTSPLFKRSNNAIFANVGEDIVALHTQLGRTYGMEKVTAAVWNLLAEPIDLDDICNHLIEQYDVTPDQCRAEIETLLDQFQREGLVEQVAV